MAQYHWLTERQFIAAITVSMITPGPVAAAAFALLAWRKVPEAAVMVVAGVIEVVARAT